MNCYIKNVPVGTQFISEYSLHPCVLLEFFGGYALLGWDVKPDDMNSWNRSHSNFRHMCNGGFVLGQEFNHINWFYWVSPTCMVDIIEDIVINANQVCSGCNLPAPHAAPNVGEKFVCASCSFLAGLDTAATGG